MLMITGFLLVLTSLTCVIGQYYSNECYNEGETCIPLQNCPSKLRNMRQGIRPKICEFNGLETYVCCNDYRNQPTLRPLLRDSDHGVYHERSREIAKNSFGGATGINKNENELRSSTRIYQSSEEQNISRIRNPAQNSNGQNWRGQNTARDYSLHISNPIDSSTERNHHDDDIRTSVWQNEVTSRPRTQKPHRKRVTQGPLSKRDQFDGTFMRISEQKCREYSSHVTEDYAAIPLLPDPEPVIFSVPKCQYDGVPLIVGGEKAELGEFPHMAAIGYRRREGGYSYSCGGSLISERFVLTAAHCASNDLDNTLANPIPQIVRLGDLNLVRDDDGADPIDVRIIDIITHPQYKPPAKYHDIALLKLQHEIGFSVNLRPACLWTKTTIDNTNAVATGWGQIDFAENPSDDLLKVVVDIFDQAKCRTMYSHSLSKRKLPLGLTSDQFCAGSEEGGRDTCGGDSGGPLQVTIEDNQCIFNLIGVTSLGKNCGKAKYPGIYTSVGWHADWIEYIVWNVTNHRMLQANKKDQCGEAFCIPEIDCPNESRNLENITGCTISDIENKYACCSSDSRVSSRGRNKENNELKNPLNNKDSNISNGDNKPVVNTDVNITKELNKDDNVKENTLSVAEPNETTTDDAANHDVKTVEQNRNRDDDNSTYSEGTFNVTREDVSSNEIPIRVQKTSGAKQNFSQSIFKIIVAVMLIEKLVAYININ